MMQSPALEALIDLLSHLPGLGGRSSRRIVLHLLKNKETAMMSLSSLLAEVAAQTKECPVCGNLDTQAPCGICRDKRRQDNLLCVTESVADIWALERARFFRGRYHVLGGVLSAVGGVIPEDLRLDSLLRRLGEEPVEELVLALGSTVDGQTTTHYIAARLKEEGLPIPVSQLAQGIPVGADLEYMDEGTLISAFSSRRKL